MFGPDWNEGCPSCSFWTDNFNGIDVHLAHRDTAFAAGVARRRSTSSRPTASAWAGPCAGCRRSATTSTSTSPSRSTAGARRRAQVQFRHPGAARPGSPRPQRLPARRRRRDLPHLFDLCPRARHAERHLPAARHHLEGPRRGGSALPDGLGAPARPLLTDTATEGMMTTLKIHGLPPSTFTRTVRLACHEKGIDYEMVDHAERRSGPLNPFRKIPADHAWRPRALRDRSRSCAISSASFRDRSCGPTTGRRGGSATNGRAPLPIRWSTRRCAICGARYGFLPVPAEMQQKYLAKTRRGRADLRPPARQASLSCGRC